ncbi:methyltransferase domain-containing protein [Nocardioides montaniterrae]
MTSFQVDETGLTLSGTGDFPLDVCFDGRRIFSFWLRRDTTAVRRALFFAWPEVLRRFLVGETTVSLVDPATGEEISRADVRFGDSGERIVVADRNGELMGLDKSMRLSRLFGERAPEHSAPVLRAMHIVLDALDAAGVEGFLAYGTLLGAVRDQDFIGHDSDADLGYVSRKSEPWQVVVESFEIQRRLQAMGLTVRRYSGIAFKIVVTESDGASRGLDVFGGFMRDGRLYLMGEVGHRFELDWIYPRSVATMAGEQFPVPAEPARMLEAMYGPTWRIPDPAYKFETPRSATRRLEGWFRGLRVGLDTRHERRRSRQEPAPRRGPSEFVRAVEAAEPDASTFIDIGCGIGQDVNWLGRQGHRAVGLDYFVPDLSRAQRVAAKAKNPERVRFEWVNLDDLRSVYVAAADLARLPGPRVVLAHHLVGTIDKTALASLLRLARVLTRDGGRLHLQVQLAPTAYSRSRALGRAHLGRIEAAVRDAGGVVQKVERLTEAQAGVPQDEATPDVEAVARLTISWKRGAR